MLAKDTFWASSILLGKFQVFKTFSMEIWKMWMSSFLRLKNFSISNFLPTLWASSNIVIYLISSLGKFWKLHSKWCTSRYIWHILTSFSFMNHHPHLRGWTITLTWGDTYKRDILYLMVSAGLPSVAEECWNCCSRQFKAFSVMKM